MNIRRGVNTAGLRLTGARSYYRTWKRVNSIIPRTPVLQGLRAAVGPPGAYPQL